MSQTSGPAPSRQARARQEPSGWAIGWTIFASLMMTLLGILWAMAGITAIANPELFVVTEEYIYRLDASTWGWIHLVVGVGMVAAGIALYTAAIWARTVGVMVASVAMLVAFAWLPYYPIWALLFIALSIAVIWSLTVHGRDITQA